MSRDTTMPVVSMNKMCATRWWHLVIATDITAGLAESNARLWTHHSCYTVV